MQERIEGPEQSDSDSDSDGDETDSEDEDMVSDGDDDDEHMVTEELAGIDLFDSVGSMLCLHEVRTIPM